MIVNTTKAEELIRRQVQAAKAEIAAIDRQLSQLTQRRAEMQAVLDEWQPTVADDPKPTEESA